MPLIFNGVTIPENVANAFTFNGVDITQVFFNNASVWLQNLIQITTTGMFYGGLASTTNYNSVIRINNSGTLIGSETNVGTARAHLAGAGLGTTGVFYAGNAVSSIVTRINASGVLIGSETNVGTARNALAGAGLGTTGVFYGGIVYPTYYNRVTRINASGTLIGSETNVGTARSYLAGAGLGTTGVFYGGLTALNKATTSYNRVTRINASGTLIGSETNVGTVRYGLAGAGLGTTGVFYGGWISNTYSNSVIRINNSGVLIGSETNVGTARNYLAGAGLGTTGVFYAGNPASSIVTRINASGVLIGSETNVGTARAYLAGAGL
jgi:fructose-specific component phosphotransferase system IIB-like protein